MKRLGELAVLLIVAGLAMLPVATALALWVDKNAYSTPLATIWSILLIVSIATYLLGFMRNNR